MFWNKIHTEEYLELKKELQKLKIELEAQSLELQLYTKKLKASKGLVREEKEETKDIYKGVLLPDNGIV